MAPLSLGRLSPQQQKLLIRRQFDLAAQVLAEKIEPPLIHLLPEAGEGSWRAGGWVGSWPEQVFKAPI